jgi:hypothetical protein
VVGCCCYVREETSADVAIRSKSVLRLDSDVISKSHIIHFTRTTLKLLFLTHPFHSISITPPTHSHPQILYTPLLKVLAKKKKKKNQ